MADDKTGRREKSCPSAAGKSGVMKKNSNEKTADFNDWLNEELHALYDPILEEPIPSDLRQIVDRLREKKR